MKSQSLLLIAALVILLFLPISVMGQPSASTIWLDGEQAGTWYAHLLGWQYENYSSVGTAMVSGEYNDDYGRWLYGSLYNFDTITTATVNTWGYLGNAGTIADVTLNGGYYYGILANWESGTINNVTINYGGLLNNYGNTNNATVNGGGALGNYYGGTISTIGTVTVNAGGTLYNSEGGTITTAIVNGGILNNSGDWVWENGEELVYMSGTITNVEVNGRWDADYGWMDGRLDNDEGGMIENATVNNGGYLENYGMTTNATVNGGEIRNRSSGTIDTVTVNSGRLLNDGGTIENATINDDGFLDNYRGTINSAIVNNNGILANFNGWISDTTINGGELHNTVGTIENATVNGGLLLNTFGTIENATQNGGTLNNTGGRIEEMAYISGTYNGQGEYSGGPYPGTIGTLALAGDSALNTGDWGIIEKLVFDRGGNGIATLTAFADGEGFGFTGIKAGYVDFSNGNISLDMTGFGGISELYDGFYLSTLFGATGFSGVDNLSSLGVTWGEDSFWILNGGVWGAGWSIDSVTGFVSYEVPEPATLLMLGLAAAGIPVVRRLRKR